MLALQASDLAKFQHRELVRMLMLEAKLLASNLEQILIFKIPAARLRRTPRCGKRCSGLFQHRDKCHDPHNAKILAKIAKVLVAGNVIEAQDPWHARAGECERLSSLTPARSTNAEQAVVFWAMHIFPCLFVNERATVF